MTDLTTLKAYNASRWQNAKLLKPASFTAIANHLINHGAKQRYMLVSAKTDIPWSVIAVIHERECSQDWSRSLAQGDPWREVSVHVPAGRGPFQSWEDAAVDALVNCAPYAARNTDWSIGGTLTKLEEYNGLGYAARGRPSPYIWSGTDQYVRGKYVRDGVYDPEAVDSQLGCAGLLLAMMALDPTISFTDQALASAPITPPARKPSLTHPSKGSVGAFIAAILSAVSNLRRT
jgi:lysozyme family protein